MRIRKRQNIVLQNIMLIIMIIIPFTWVGIYGIKSSQGWERILQFQYEGSYDPDTEFLTANYTRLAEMADVYDDLFQKNHLPLNFSTFAIYIDENSTDVSHYSYTDNGALWTGIAMAAWVFHYMTAKIEGDTAEMGYTLEVISRMIHGFKMMMVVPNGGLGPDYSGILARGWAGPQHKEIAPMFFQEGIRHFNGTGDYSQWRWRGFTSNDEYGGFYMGLALALKFVEDTWVQETVGLIVLQLANYMLETNFLGISGPGGPSGVNQKPTFGSGGFWIATLLKMASIVEPETYEPYFNHWISSELLYLSLTEGNPGETLANYYAYNFGHCNILAFLILEGTETRIGQTYFDGYLNSMRSYTYNHRNAWFNAIYLLLSGANPGDHPIIERDIEDQLMRLEINNFPDRRNRPVPVPETEDVFTEISELYEEIYSNNWSALYALPYIEMNLERQYFIRAQTVEHHYHGSFFWEKNPFRNETGTHHHPNVEGPGTTFTVPYWMMRYMGIIPKSGVRVL